MDKQEVIALSQLLDSMLEASKILEKAYNRKDFEALQKTKREIMDIKNKIDTIVGK